MNDANPNDSKAVARQALLAGATLCVLAVAFGAFGAHALADILAQTGQSKTFELANRYHFYHGLGLLLVATLAFTGEFSDGLQWVVGLLFFGALIFSGSLYVLALTNVKWLGAITPIGGVCLLVGWGLLLKHSVVSLRR